MLIRATEVVAGEDADVFCVSFSSAGGAALEYLTLQRSKTYDEQDCRLGMDDVHVERNDQRWGAYGGITAVELHRDRLCVVFDNATARKLGLGGDLGIEVRFAVGSAALRELQQTLGHVFLGRACFTDRTV